MKGFSILPVLAAAAGLAACDSVDGGSGYNDLLLEGGMILDRYEGTAATPVEQMPPGSATYNGVAAYSTVTSDPGAIADNPEALSHITLSANFDTADISGRLYDFRTASNDQIAGELAITGGTITGNTFDADVGGVLDEAGNVTTYDGDMIGAFVGTAAEAVTGVAAFETTAGGLPAGTVYGTFAADQ